MTVVAIDTNVLLDYALERPGYRQHHDLFLRADRGEIRFYVALSVILECEWLVRSFYRRKKSAVIVFLGAVLELPSVNPTEMLLWQSALDLYERSVGVSFDDCIILTLATAAKADQFVTGDRKLAALYRKLR